MPLFFPLPIKKGSAHRYSSACSCCTRIRESLFHINWGILFNRDLMKQNCSFGKAQHLSVAFTSYFHRRHEICMFEKVLFLKKKTIKDLSFSVSYLPEALPYAPLWRDKRFLSCLWFCASPLVAL